MVGGGGGGGGAAVHPRTQPATKAVHKTRALGQFSEITSQRLLDQSQAGVYRGKRHIPPHFGPFWAYSGTLPQGVELLV